MVYTLKLNYKIELVKVKKAVGIGYGFHIYFPDDDVFLKIDDSEHDGNECNFYFDEIHSLNGNDEYMISYNENDSIFIIDTKNRNLV